MRHVAHLPARPGECLVRGAAGVAGKTTLLKAADRRNQKSRGQGFHVHLFARTSGGSQEYLQGGFDQAADTLARLFADKEMQSQVVERGGEGRWWAGTRCRHGVIGT